jgi:hypothetical protein
MYCYAECHNAECRYAECRYAECHYAECCYAECRHAECRDTHILAYNDMELITAIKCVLKNRLQVP